MAVGIPSGGLFTGAEDNITMADAQLFDLPVNDYYDACYHRACDGLDNIHFQVFTEMSDATTHVLTRLSSTAENQETRALRRTQRAAHQMPERMQEASHQGCHAGELVR